MVQAPPRRWVLVQPAGQGFLRQQALIDQLFEDLMIFRMAGRKLGPRLDLALGDGLQFDIAKIDWLAVHNGGSYAFISGAFRGYVRLGLTGAQPGQDDSARKGSAERSKGQKHFRHSFAAFA